MVRRFRPALLSGMLLLLGTGCSQMPTSDHPTEVRITNRSNVPFTRAVLRSPGGDAEFGPIAPGQASSYQPVDEAYPFPYIEVQIGTATRVLQPIDFMDPPLEPGRYTYALSLSVEPPFLDVQLRRR